MAKLIITADDYGLDAAINSGIRTAVRYGAITSVHIMANLIADAPEELVLLMKEKNIQNGFCGIGLHLNTTEGPSLLQEPTNFTESREGIYYFKSIHSYNFSTHDLFQIQKELLAQYSTLNNLLKGHSIEAISSHHSFHLLWKEGIAVLSEYSSKNTFGIRSPLLWNHQNHTKNYYKGVFNRVWNVLNNIPKGLSTRAVLKLNLNKRHQLQLMALIKRNNAFTPNSTFNGWFVNPSLSAVEWLDKSLTQKPRVNYVTEIFTHLSDSPKGGNDKWNYSMKQRYAEYETLIAPDFLQKLEELKGLELTSYARVKNAK